MVCRLLWFPVILVKSLWSGRWSWIMNSDLAPTIYDIALYDGSVRYMQRKKNKPSQLTKQFTVKNGNFWTVYAKLLTMYKSILFTWNGFKHCDSQIKFFFSNVTLIARNIVILKQKINEIAICQKSHRSQFWNRPSYTYFPVSLLL